ncbi:MAG: hypothetical protein ACI8XB_002356 [Patiriisocius sp.]|jgi:hypothetical protein
MKKLILCSMGLVASAMVYGQTADMVSLGAGYANESYYSFENGEVVNDDNQNWHLALDMSAFGATVRLNRKQAELYDSEEVIANWGNTIDTTGQFGVWEQYINGYDWWSEGAMNNVADGSNPLDLGWGDYNTVTHQIIGTRIFILKLNNGDCKKLVIESLIGGDYSIKHADLDGTNEVTQTITKSDYLDRNFAYYNASTNSVLDREPANDSWDIVFTNYVLELAPNYYSSVTGALHNDGVTISKVAGVPVATSMYTGMWDTTINIIGYDWKTFNFGTFSYDIVDSLSYFVQTENNDIWKLVFTDFEGSTNGNIHFTTEQIEYAGVPVYEGANLEVYPNPATNLLHIKYAHDVERINITDMNGQLVLENSKNISSIDISNLQEGIYLLKVVGQSGQSSVKRIVIQH